MTARVKTHTEFLDELPMLRFHWLLVLGIALAQVLDGFDFMSTSFALPKIISDLNLTQSQAGAIASATNLGLVVGALVFAALADKYGRKPIFQVVLFTYAFGSFLSAIVPSYEWLLAARFVAGLGIVAEFPVAFALLAEYSPRKYRSRLIPLGPLFYAVGWVVAALVSIWVVPTFGWRLLYWLGILPTLVILFVRRYIPESVRYLLSKGRRAEADKIVHRLAEEANLSVELPAESAPAREVGEGKQERIGWGLFRNHLSSIVVLSLLYFCFFIQNFGITAWLPTLFIKQGFAMLQSFAFTLLIFSVTPVAQLFGAWAQDIMPRKWLLFWLSLLSGAFFVIFGLAFQYQWHISVAIAAQLLSGFLANAVVAVLYTLATEVFPTRIRSQGMGLVTAAGRGGAVVGPLLVGVLLQGGLGISSMIYMFAMPLLLAAIVSITLLRGDTRLKGLEEIEESSNLAG